MIEKDKYKKTLSFIEKYWAKITYQLDRNCDIHISLPNAFIAPSDHWFGEDQFYWDTYFEIIGLLEVNRFNLAKGMVDNLIYLYEHFDIIPSRNRLYNLGISQPPFLTSMIEQIYKVKPNKKWLSKAVDVAEQELYCYWMGLDHGVKHMVHKGLSRYCDHHINHITAEHESGWDMTSRFKDQCLSYLPVDLNCLLYKYEIDLKLFYQELGKEEKVKEYAQRATRRKQHINELMWSDRKGFFFDFNYINKKQHHFYTLAGFYPLWAGLADEEQAQKVRGNLKKFEYEFGLSATQKEGLDHEFRQWDWPNGWAPLHWIVYSGLKRYGFDSDAKRIATKWIELNRRVFNRTGKFWERYNVVNGKRGETERYPIQWGFGWTNAIFVKFYNELTKEKKWNKKNRSL